MVDAFSKFDGVRASGRLLITINDAPIGLSLVDLYEKMRRRYGVGKSVVNSSRQVCKELGLIIIFEAQKFGAPRNVLVHHVTPKGIEVAEKLKEIEYILTNA